MKIIYTKVKNSLTADHIKDIMKMNLLGKEPTGMKFNAWFCQIMIDLLAMNTRVGPKSTKVFCENLLAIWKLQ